MSTTSLFIEILIIGYMGLSWVIVIFAIIFEIPDMQVFISTIDKVEILIAIALTSFAYYLGIIIDRISDSLLEAWDERIRKKIKGVGDPPVLSMQAILFIKAPESVERFGYQQNRLRVVRAAIINVGLFFFTSLIYIFTRLGNGSARINALALMALVVVLWAATFFAYNRITWSYWKRTRREYLALMGTAPNNL